MSDPVGRSLSVLSERRSEVLGKLEGCEELHLWRRLKESGRRGGSGIYEW